MTVSEKAASSTSISADMSLNLPDLGYTCIHMKALAHAVSAFLQSREHAASDDGSLGSEQTVREDCA